MKFEPKYNIIAQDFFWEFLKKCFHRKLCLRLTLAPPANPLTFNGGSINFANLATSPTD